MPLRRPPTKTEPASNAPGIGDLSHPSPEVRRAAALGQRDHPETVDLRLDALAAETDDSVRQAILSSLAPPLPEGAVGRLTGLLRSDDAALRSDVTTWLEPHGDLVAPYVPELLDDPDPDVRILTLNLVGTSDVPAASSLLVGVLERETHENVVCAALEALAEVGDAQAIEAVRSVRARFADEPFVAFAADHVLRRLEG